MVDTGTATPTLPTTPPADTAEASIKATPATTPIKVNGQEHMSPPGKYVNSDPHDHSRQSPNMENSPAMTSRKMSDTMPHFKSTPLHAQNTFSSSLLNSPAMTTRSPIHHQTRENERPITSFPVPSTPIAAISKMPFTPRPATTPLWNTAHGASAEQADDFSSPDLANGLPSIATPSTATPLSRRLTSLFSSTLTSFLATPVSTSVSSSPKHSAPQLHDIPAVHDFQVAKDEASPMDEQKENVLLEYVDTVQERNYAISSAFSLSSQEISIAETEEAPSNVAVREMISSPVTSADSATMKTAVAKATLFSPQPSRFVAQSPSSNSQCASGMTTVQSSRVSSPFVVSEEQEPSAQISYLESQERLLTSPVFADQSQSQSPLAVTLPSSVEIVTSKSASSPKSPRYDLSPSQTGCSSALVSPSLTSHSPDKPRSQVIEEVINSRYDESALNEASDVQLSSQRMECEIECGSPDLLSPYVTRSSVSLPTSPSVSSRPAHRSPLPSYHQSAKVKKSSYLARSPIFADDILESPTSPTTGLQPPTSPSEYADNQLASVEFQFPESPQTNEGTGDPVCSSGNNTQESVLFPTLMTSETAMSRAHSPSSTEFPTCFNDKLAILEENLQQANATSAEFEARYQSLLLEKLTLQPHSGKLSSLFSDANSLDLLQNQVSTNFKDTAVAVLELLRFRDDRLRMLESESENLEASLSRETIARQNLEETLHSAQAECLQLQQHVKTGNDALKTQKDRVAELFMKNDNYTKEIANLNAQLQDLKQSLQESRSKEPEITRLHGIIEQMRKQHDELIAFTEEERKIRAEIIEDHEATIESIQKELQWYNVHASPVIMDALKQDVERLTVEKAEVSQKLQVALEQQAAAEKAFEEERSQLSSSIHTLTSERDSLTAQFAKESEKAKELAVIVPKYERAMSLTKQLQFENDESKKKLTQTKAQLDSKISELREQKATLDRLLKQFDAAAENQNAIRKPGDDVSEKLMATSQELEKTKEELRLMSAEMENYFGSVTEVTALQSEIKELQETMANLKNQNLQMTGELHSLTLANEHLSKEKIMMEAQHADQISQLQAANSALETKLDEISRGFPETTSVGMSSSDSAVDENVSVSSLQSSFESEKLKHLEEIQRLLDVQHDQETEIGRLRMCTQNSAANPDQVTIRTSGSNSSVSGMTTDEQNELRKMSTMALQMEGEAAALDGLIEHVKTVMERHKSVICQVPELSDLLDALQVDE